MEDMINLNDLLRHEILDLYSAEEQIIDALPAMIEKANDGELKKALRNHLDVTKKQKDRLDQIKGWMGEDPKGQNKGFFSRVFSGGEKCKGTEGLLTEGKKMMNADASEEVRDAAIIASAQKVEHYEICGYGTARTYARELGLNKVADLLEQTLNEEYDADDLLTRLATSKINLEAENATSLDKTSRPARSNGSDRRPGGKTSSGSGGKSTASNKSSERKSVNARSNGSSNGRGSSKNNSSNKQISSKSSSTASSKSGSKTKAGRNNKSSKRSQASTKKSSRSKSGVSR